MFEPMTRERLETIFETFKRDALIAGIAPPDWDKTIERVRDMAIEALRQADKAMTPEQLDDIREWNKLRGGLPAKRDVSALLAEITRLTAALEEAEKRGYDTAKEHAANSVFTSIANASVKGNGTNVSRRWLMDLIKTAQADIRAMEKQ